MPENGWVAAAVQFEVEVAYPGADAAATVRGIPAAPGVFALYGAAGPDGVATQPYLTRAADMRRRVARLLAPAELGADGAPVQSKRLNLRERVARIAWTVTGSEFESAMVLYRAATAVYGAEEARRRLRLHTPFFLRFTAENRFPRVYATNRLSKRALETTYGPFPSRAAAERYCDAVLDLFQLRRCWEDLEPAAEHPGCIYGEIGKCLRPCQRAGEAEGAAEYAGEAAAVRRFFDTRGESMVVAIGLEREEASAAMQFERAAELHVQWQKVRGVQALADELVGPVLKVRAVVVQKAVKQGSGGGAEEAGLDAAVFLVEAGRVYGPERLSTLGVRAVREQTSVGSSLFAQPLMLQAVPLAEGSGEAGVAAPVVASPAESPEVRAAGVVKRLEERVTAAEKPDVAVLSDHLAMVRRWYYRPEKQRAGEVFLPDANGQWPVRRILNGAARVVLGDPAKMAETQRELAERNAADGAARPVKTKVLHEGRPDVERVVPVVEKVFRSRKKRGE
jgi:excinuclease ABC subunit C